MRVTPLQESMNHVQYGDKSRQTIRHTCRLIIRGLFSIAFERSCPPRPQTKQFNQITPTTIIYQFHHPYHKRFASSTRQPYKPPLIYIPTLTYSKTTKMSTSHFTKPANEDTTDFKHYQAGSTLWQPTPTFPAPGIWRAPSEQCGRIPEPLYRLRLSVSKDGVSIIGDLPTRMFVRFALPLCPQQALLCLSLNETFKFYEIILSTSLLTKPADRFHV